MKFKFVHFVAVAVVVTSLVTWAVMSTQKPGVAGVQSNYSMSENIITTASGLKYIDTTEGTGEVVKSGDMISIHYTGTLEDGTKFDSSEDRGQPFQTRIDVGQVIPGWDEGVVGMKVGGERTLIIPSDLAYGDSGIPGVIPGGATLIFKVRLMAIN